MGLVHDLPGMAYRCRNDRDWTLKFASAGAEELTGYDRRRLEANDGVTYAELIHPDDRDRVWQQIQRSLRRREQFQISYRIRTASGRTKWVWEQGRGVFADDGKVECLEGFVFDVTDRKEAEERFRRIFETTPLGILIYELDGDGRPRLAATNPAAREILGLDEDRLLGKPIGEAFPDLAKTELPGIYAELARDGGVWRSDQVAYDDGAIRGVFAVHAFQTTPGQMAAMFEDVTAERQREREVRRLSKAVEQAAGSVMITDLDGTIEYVNPAFEELSGYTREEAVGQTSALLKSGEHDQDFYRDLWETITAGETWTGTLVNRAKDGELFHEEKTISAIRDDSGEIVSFLAIGRDITKEKGLEEQVRRAQRLESVGRLAGGVAHDFNNLLTTVVGNVGFALEAVDAGEVPAREDLEAIRTAAESATALTRQLLLFSRKQPMELGRVDVNELVEGMEGMLSRLIREDIDLEIRLVGDPWGVRADRGQLEQVLLNLIVNATDAMPDGGELEIRTANVEIDREYSESHFAVTPGDYVALTVSDTGVGMDRRTRARIFEPFFTTKEEGRGTGLGLATAHGIVKQHGGHIWVYSEPGSGSVFKVYLPRARGREEEKASGAGIDVDTADAWPPTSPCGSDTVLIVDDDGQILRMAAQILERVGYRTLKASHPQEALEILASGEDEVDLLLTDAVMPEMSGAELAEHFFSLRPGGRVLFMSGYAEDSVRRWNPRGPESRQVICLPKPFTAGALADKVREALAP